VEGTLIPIAQVSLALFQKEYQFALGSSPMGLDVVDSHLEIRPLRRKNSLAIRDWNEIDPKVL
jgi:hypothetical protein